MISNNNNDNNNNNNNNNNKEVINIYSLQFSIIFICYLNALVFTGISYFSCFG